VGACARESARTKEERKKECTRARELESEMVRTRVRGVEREKKRHTANTHSNTLQHIAKHCNTLQYTATRARDVEREKCRESARSRANVRYRKRAQASVSEMLARPGQAIMRERERERESKWRTHVHALEKDHIVT